jgi:cobalt-zinc-cadmium resistance protein CzcA
VLFNSGKSKGIKLPKVVASFALLILGTFTTSIAQETPKLTLEDALQLAEKQNFGILASQKRLESAQALTRSSWSLGKTELYHKQDQNDIAENGVFNRVWGIRQSFDFPTVYGAQKNFYKAAEQQESALFELDLRTLKKEVSTAFVTAQ